MKIYFTCDEGERMTNFRVAEAIVNLCNESWNIDAETIAEMILSEVKYDKEKRE